MKHIKYSNKIVMYIISIGYVILVLIVLLMHLNIMYALSPYALLTFWCINYTRKRSVNFTRYQIGFELGINKQGNFFKFCILASVANSDIEVLKLNYYQTQYIINIPKLQTMLSDLSYSIHYLPDFESQAIMHRLTHPAEPIDVNAFHYEQIADEYNIFKTTVINKFKQNVSNLLELNVNQPIFNLNSKKRKSLTSFLRY